MEFFKSITLSIVLLSIGLLVANACTNTDIRLVNGSNSLEGRLEVCLNGAWGTVCDDYWGIEEAVVVCKQLGYIFGIPVRNAYFGQGNGNIVMDNVQCTGTEPSITNCIYTSHHNCLPSEDAGVICTLVCSEGALQLVNGSSMFEGRVEICYNNTWGTICDDNWNNANAQVVCRQLGFLTTGAYYRAGAYYGQGQGSIVLDNVQCDGSEASLFLQCSHSFPLLHNCNHNEDVGVVCPSTYSCTQGSLRLVDGNYFSIGRLEICVNNQWGTVCDNGWTNLNAQVVCKQLGHSSLSTYEGAVFLPNAFFGRGSGSIFLDNVQCTGTEDTLIDCSHSSLGSSSCGHNDDVSIFCLTADLPSTGTIILSRNNVSSTSFNSGTVRVYDYGWGNICDDSAFGLSEAHVICHQLGYSGASTYGRAGQGSYGTDDLPMKWDDVSCSSSSYLSISQCFYSTTIDSGCFNSNSYDATVSCYTTRIWDDPFPGMIRLQGGTYSDQGRVEVYCNGQWGTICNAGFDSIDATTLCRQLGYDDYLTYNHLPVLGSSAQPIWSSNMISSSFDVCFTSRNSCPTSSISSCTHERDVTLHCRDSASAYGLIVNKTTCRIGISSSAVKSTPTLSATRSSTLSLSMTATATSTPDTATTSTPDTPDITLIVVIVLLTVIGIVVVVVVVVVVLGIFLNRRRRDRANYEPHKVVIDNNGAG